MAYSDTRDVDLAANQAFEDRMEFLRREFPHLSIADMQRLFLSGFTGGVDYGFELSVKRLVDAFHEGVDT